MYNVPNNVYRYLPLFPSSGDHIYLVKRSLRSQVQNPFRLGVILIIVIVISLNLLYVRSIYLWHHALYTGNQDPIKLFQNPEEVARLRQGILEPHVQPFLQVRTQNDTVPVSPAPLFGWPDEEIPSHVIRTFERRIQLDARAPRLDQMMFVFTLPIRLLQPLRRVKTRFIFTTTASRAATYSVFWPHAMRPHHAANQIPCVIVLPPEDQDQTEHLRTTLQARGLECHLAVSTLDKYELRVLSSLGHSWQAADTTKIKWFVVNDDDTIWLDTAVLQRTLSAYDPNDAHFFGGYTESVGQLKSYGRQAYGGGGMILSRETMRRLMDNDAALLQECFEHVKDAPAPTGQGGKPGWRLEAAPEVWRMGGDTMITYAAARAKNVPYSESVELMEGLHQLDIPGPVSGLLQSGLFFLSMHHLIANKGWAQLFPKTPERADWPMVDDWLGLSIYLKAASFLGGDNFLQRYAFDDGRVQLVNGYSVTVYTYPLTEEELRQVEYSWWYKAYNTVYPQRPQIYESADESRRHIDQRKSTFYIRDVDVDFETNNARFLCKRNYEWTSHYNTLE